MAAHFKHENSLDIWKSNALDYWSYIKYDRKPRGKACQGSCIDLPNATILLHSFSFSLLFPLQCVYAAVFLVFVNLHYKATMRLFLILHSMREGVKKAKITADILYAWSAKVLQLQSNMSHLGLVKRLSEACSTKKQLEKEQPQMPGHNVK